MTIINVIQIGQTSQSFIMGIVGIKSFVCEDEQLYGKVEKEVEDYFTQLLEELGIDEDKIDECLMDRFYEGNSQSVSIVISEPENLQQ